MSHETDGFPRAPERYVDDLRRMASARLGPALRGRLDASDVVQQTLLIAIERGGQFRGATRAEYRCWLRMILDRLLGGASRRARRALPERALSLDRSLSGSSAGPAAWLAGEDSTPSARAARDEESLRLAAAMAALPDDQRTALELHYFRALTVAEVAAEMGRTAPAAAGLIFRGGRALRRALD